MVIGGEEPGQQRRYGNKDTIFFFLRSVPLLSAIRDLQSRIYWAFCIWI